MTNPIPDWILNTPSTQAIHNQPPRAAGELVLPFTPVDLFNIGAELIAQFLQRVVEAVVGFFIPGRAGAAFDQLADWANGLVNSFSGIITQIANLVAGTSGGIFGTVPPGGSLDDLIDLIPDALRSIPFLNIAGVGGPQNIGESVKSSK